MSFCYFKKSHSGFFACIFCPWVNCCDLRGWVAFPSNPSAMASRPIGCASPASGRRPIHGCRQMSANLLAFVSELVDKCRPTCRQMSATETLRPPNCLAKAQRTQRPHPIAGAVPCAGPKGMFDRFHYKIGWVISLGPARGTAPAADTRIHARGWMHAFVFLLWSDWGSPPS